MRQDVDDSGAVVIARRQPHLVAQHPTQLQAQQQRPEGAPDPKYPGADLIKQQALDQSHRKQHHILAGDHGQHPDIEVLLPQDHAFLTQNVIHAVGKTYKDKDDYLDKAEERKVLIFSKAINLCPGGASQDQRGEQAVAVHPKS